MAPNRRWIAWATAATFALLVVSAAAASAATSPPVGSWQWPILGPVIRGFAPPPTPYSSGHRGIDIAASFGTPVRAPADGTVSFAGPVGGSLFVTIDHPDGYKSTSSYLSRILVHRNQRVTAGEILALSGRGHPEVSTTHLHFGVRLDGEYIDPLSVLAPQSVVDIVSLAPVQTASGPRPAWTSRAPGSFGPIPFDAFLLRERQAMGLRSA
jgi:murein DD-endopeptidase MepM/ murein hydrolase activator NlpD